MNRSKKIKLCKFIFIFSILVLISILYSSHLKQDNLLGFLTIVEQLSTPEALSYFCLIFIVSSVLCLPLGLPLNLFAGMIWGTLWGGILINLLAALVASIAFQIARLLKRYMLEDSLNKYFALNTFRKFINCHDWEFIFAARINPIVPFSVSNYLFGFIPELPFERYLYTTILANLIPAFAFASVGSALGTFSPQDANVRSALSRISCVLILFSMLFFIKWLLAKKTIFNLKGSL